MELFGDLRCEDPERKNCLNFVNTTLTGAISGFPRLQLTEGSSWVATKDSFVTLIGTADGIDAAAGVTVTAKSNSLGSGAVSLPSGGTLLIS